MNNQRSDNKSELNDLAPETEIKRIKELIHTIKSGSNGYATNNTSQDLVNDYSKIKDDISNLIEIYLLKGKASLAKPTEEDILKDFDTIIQMKVMEPNQVEINIPRLLSENDINKINDLFILLDKEVGSGTNRIKLSDIPKSKDKIVDGAQLTKVFDELADQAIEQEEILRSTESIIEEIPSPAITRVLFAFIIDLLLILTAGIYVLAKYLKIDLSFETANVMLHTHTILYFQIAISLWFLVQGISLVIMQATLGQSILNIVVATEQNSNPAFPKLLLRLSLHLINFCTLGTYSLLVHYKMHNKERGVFYCLISKTKLTFKGFTEGLPK